MSEGYKLYGGTGVEINPLEVTEDGTYTAPMGKAFNPVKVSGGGGGGSGSGVLVVNAPYDETTGMLTFDKTWQEVHDATMVVVVSAYDDGDTNSMNYFYVETISYNRDDPPSYYVGLFNSGGPITAETSSADGYPSFPD